MITLVFFSLMQAEPLTAVVPVGHQKTDQHEENFKKAEASLSELIEKLKLKSPLSAINILHLKEEMRSFTRSAKAAGKTLEHSSVYKKAQELCEALKAT